MLAVISVHRKRRMYRSCRHDQNTENIEYRFMIAYRNTGLVKNTVNCDLYRYLNTSNILAKNILLDIFTIAGYTNRSSLV